MKLEFRDATGRAVRVSSLTLTETYGGVHEGSAESVSPRLLARQQRWAAEGPHRQVIAPSALPLPAWCCTAYLESRASTPGKYGAGLEVVFWLEISPESSLAEVFTSILPLVDWSLAREWAADDD
jgi:hypothetical protein